MRRLGHHHLPAVPRFGHLRRRRLLSEETRENLHFDQRRSDQPDHNHVPDEGEF